MTIGNKQQVERVHIYVGLNRADVGVQTHETEKYFDLVAYLCRHNGIPYTAGTTRGGYVSRDGSYVAENSIDITLLNPTEEFVLLLSSELCAMLGQECVMVTRDKAEMYYISDEI